MKSIRTSLMLAFISVLLLPIIALIFYGHFFTSRALSNQAVARSMDEVHLQAEHFVQSLEQVHSDILYLSALRSFKQFRTVSADDEITIWQDEAAQDFLVLASVRPMYHRIRYISPTGQTIIGIETEDQFVRLATAEELSHRFPYFDDVMALEDGEIFVSSFDLDSENPTIDTALLRYAMKLGDDEGIIVLEVYASWMLRYLEITASGDAWALIDQNGRFLIYPENQYTTSFSPFSKRFLANTMGTFENEDSVFVFDRVYPTANTPNQFWILYRESPSNIFYASVNDFYQKGVIFVIGGALLATLVALYASHYIVSPIRKLEHQAENFAKGIMPQKDAIMPQNEIGMLSRAFHSMAMELDKKRCQERRLIEQLITAQEEERKLIAYDLHDGLIQQLVGARFHLSTCQSHCPWTETKAAEGLKRGCEALTEAITEGRRIIEGLRPSMLDTLGLTEALKDTVHSIAQTTNWNLDLHLNHLPKEPDMATCVTLFRIAQEALNNIRKHAKATEVRLELSNGSGIALEVTDNGCGFDMESTHDKGFGITTMRERAILISGTCSIESNPGSGTRIKVWVPYEQGEKHDCTCGDC